MSPMDPGFATSEATASSQPLALSSYLVDAWQRSVLFLDVMRQRSDQAEQHAALDAPNVLSYDVELVSDGRELPRAVNYGLVAITPPGGVVIDQSKRPFIIIDPRAGHGPGIGGFKADSEIGVAMNAGHPCYFIGFLPEPMPSQTIEDVMNAEAAFVETVIARHPDADGKPCVIGNCQAGWALMMLASLRPELFGPLIIAGAPLSYWAGVHGENPMRYSGGLLGGSWLTALTNDLGAGKFDGAWLVQNFENQNPANTLWTKQYNLYSKIDTETERYLDFERWWGGHVTLNAEEMQFIVDELFIGNKLAAGEIRTSEGVAIDLRNVRSPIVIFCSRGDNITPPQQALGWILDLYDDVEEIRAYGQTIVYTIHDTVGHLGIFVSAGVARKQHDEFASNIDQIDMLPPGLYEAVLTPKSEVTRPDLVTGEWLMRCEPRTLDDIHALGGNDPEDERRFEAAARVSEINLSLYRAFARPIVNAMVQPQAAEAMRELHPLRVAYEVFGSRNPFNGWIADCAARIREDRRDTDPENPFLALQEQVSGGIVDGLENWRKFTEKLSEETFRAIYGSSTLQALLGIDQSSEDRPRKAGKSLLHTELVKVGREQLRSRMTEGGLREALVRTLMYIGITPDERGFAVYRRFRREHPAARQLTSAMFKALVREQYYMLLIDEPAAMAALPGILPKSIDERRAAFALLEELLAARDPLDAAGAARLRQAEKIFGLDRQSSAGVAPGRSNAA